MSHEIPVTSKYKICKNILRSHFASSLPIPDATKVAWSNSHHPCARLKNQSCRMGGSETYLKTPLKSDSDTQNDGLENVIFF